MRQQLISIVVPVYNETNILSSFYQRLQKVLQSLQYIFEIIFVNDGSTDLSLESLIKLRNQDERIAIVHLSRNFGKEIALQAGLDHCKGDAVIVMDADLQDPPELIPCFLEQWRQGFDVVYGKRVSRHGESLFKKSTAFIFYRLIRRMSTISIPADTGDFRLLSHRAVSALKQLPERHRYMKGLFAWIGFPQIAVPFERQARVGGTSKWNYVKLFNLALEGITSFSLAPLKLATFFGFITASLAFIYASRIIYKTLIYGDPVQGYPSLMVVILFLGGVQLISLGIIGEYLGRTFDETKRRPLYLLNEFYPANEYQHYFHETQFSSARSYFADPCVNPVTEPGAVPCVNSLDSFANKYSTTSKTAFSVPAIDAVTK